MLSSPHASTSFALHVSLSSVSPPGLGKEAEILERRPLERSPSFGHRWNKP